MLGTSAEKEFKWLADQESIVMHELPFPAAGASESREAALMAELVALRQRAEAAELAALKAVESRTQLTRLFEQAPAMFAVLQGPQHQFVFCNALYQAVFPGKQLIGKTVREAMPELEGQGIYEMLDGVFQTAEPCVGKEVKMRFDPDGSGELQDLYFNFLYFPSRDDAGEVNGLLVQAMDITAHVKIRQTLEVQRRFAETLLDRLPAGVTYIDKDFVFRVVNPALARFYGKPLAEILDRHVYDVLPGSEESIGPLYQQVKETLQALTLEAVPVPYLLDGQERLTYWDATILPYIGVDGAFDGWLALAFEVSEKVILEQEREAQVEAVRTSQMHLAGVLDSATSGVMAMEAVRDETGAVVDFVFTLGNPKSEELTRLPTETVLGRRLLELFPSNVESGQMAMYRRVMDTGKSEFLETYYNDGRLDFWLDVSAARMGANGIAVTFTDVSDRRRVERDRDEAQQARIQALEEANTHKEQFLGILSHELRTPLNAIQGFGSVLEDGIAGELAPAQANFVGKILAASDHMLALVDDLLDLSRVQAGKLSLSVEKVELAPMVRASLVELAAQALGKDQVLANRVRADLPWVTADPGRLRQVLSNLVGNAIKYTPEGGSIMVRAKVEGDFVRVEVEDTGIGIAPEEQARIFESFTQLDMTSTRSKGGVGLGLSIVRALVEAQGGQVGVASQPGLGSTFWFTLPFT
jgi:signal transduction histidine kinase